MWNVIKKDGRRIGFKRRARRLPSVLMGSFVVGSLVLAGCASTGTGAGAPSGSADGSLQNVLNRDSLRVGVCLALPPWGLISTSGQPEGFDVDLAQQLGKFIGVPVEIKEVTGAGRVPALQSGQVDASACTFTITPERKQQVNFSNPVISSGMSLVVMGGSVIKSVGDLAGHSVAVPKGSTSIPIVQKAAPKANLQQFEAVQDCFLALKQGQVDAVVEATQTVSLAAAQDPRLVIVENGTLGDRVYLALGVPKGKKALLDKVNGFVAEFHSSGADKTLFAKWFGVDPGKAFDDLPATENLP